MSNTKRKNDENDEISIKNKKSKIVTTQDQQNDSGVSVILELPGVSREKKISYNVQDEEILQGDWTELPLSKYVTTHLKGTDFFCKKNLRMTIIRASWI